MRSHLRLPQHTRHWWPIVEDVFFSAAALNILQQLLQQAIAREEYVSISIDGTMKCCMALMGQPNWRHRGANSCAGAAEQAWYKAMSF